MKNIWHTFTIQVSDEIYLTLLQTTYLHIIDFTKYCHFFDFVKNCPFDFAEMLSSWGSTTNTQICKYFLNFCLKRHFDFFEPKIPIWIQPNEFLPKITIRLSFKIPDWIQHNEFLPKMTFWLLVKISIISSFTPSQSEGTCVLRVIKEILSILIEF